MPKQKTCKHCQTKFTPVSALVPYCTPKCQREAERARKAEKTAKAKASREKKREKIKNSLPAMRKKADILWSVTVRTVGFCEYCGTDKFLNAHHIFSRTNNATRWDFDNGICLCAKHHTFSNDFSAHKTPCEFTMWFLEKFGEDRFQRIREKAREVHNADVDFIRSEIYKLNILY